MKMQTTGRVSRPGKAKAITPPLSKGTSAATSGAAAQRRLNQKAGVKNGERRRGRARDRDSHGKPNAHSDRRGRALDCEHPCAAIATCANASAATAKPAAKRLWDRVRNDITPLG